MAEERDAAEHAAATLELLNDGERLLDERIAQLTADRTAVPAHARALIDAAARPVGTPAIESHPPCKCVELSAHIQPDEEIDFLIQGLHYQYGRILPHLGMLEIGGHLARAELEAGRVNVYDSAFFALEGHEHDDEASYDELLPEGGYLTLRYRGSYEQNGAVYRQLIAYASDCGVELAEQPYEFYEIDNRDTGDPTEHLSHIEIRVP